jgi:hypothetical protein
MLSVLLCGALLLIATTFIHYEMLRLAYMRLPRLCIPARFKVMAVIFAAFVAHALEIVLYATGFFILTRVGAGSLGPSHGLTLPSYLYFSAETYTSLGYGDLVPHASLRMLAGMEALNGLLLIGWSSSTIYIAMEKFWAHGNEE